MGILPVRAGETPTPQDQRLQVISSTILSSQKANLREVMEKCDGLSKDLWRWIVPARWASLLLVGMLILGCSATVPPVSSGESKPQTIAPSSPAEAAQSEAGQTEIAQKKPNLGQMLPITAQVKIADQIIQLEVAQTDEQQAMGLMHRTKLEANRGMLFPFNPPRRVGFWMKNVSINLDMVFLYQGKVAAIASDVPPCKEEPCAVYGAKGLIDQVIELRGGRAKELGLKVGDRLTVTKLF